MIAVTGATGNLGGLVVETLLDEGASPSDIVAAVRSPDKAEDLADRGIDVRKTDYDLPDTLESTFRGVERLLLISSSEVGQRIEQHGNVVDAAEKTGVDFFAYTSMVRADTSPLKLAEEHRATEQRIRESGIPFTLLRNGWYTENYTENLGPVLERGVLVNCAGDGRVSAATRADYAAGAATVLTEDGHEGKVYELGGNEAFTMEELAEELTRQSDTEVVYQQVSEDEHVDILKDAGLPEGYAEVLGDADRGIADGHLYVEEDDLHHLIGRPTTPLAEAVAEALS